MGWLIGHVRGSGDDDDPMMMSQQFALVVVPPPLVFVGAMMIAVIFDGDAKFGPSEIERYRRTVDSIGESTRGVMNARAIMHLDFALNFGSPVTCRTKS